MAWSPDGRFLAVVDRESPTEPHAIFLLSLESGDKRRVTSPKDVRGDIQPAFSPDGATLAFARLPGLHDGQIFLQELGGGDPSPLARVEGYITDLDWAADGAAVVFAAASESEAGTRLFRVPATGGEPQRLPFGEMAHTFSISRRDNRLVHDRRSWFNHDIWRIDGPAAEERGSPTRLIASSRFDWDQEYSPDGTKIAFASERSGNNNIWICDSDGSGCRQLTDMKRAVTPRWSPDGKQLAFTGQEEGEEGGLYLADVEGGFTRPIPGTDWKDCCASWSHDGRWIYFTSDRTGGPQIWRIPAEGGEATRITRDGGLNQQESSDGRFLFYAEKPGLAPIRRVPVDGGEEVPISKGGEAASLAWALWNDEIVYATADPDDPRVHIDVFDLETGESKRIFTSSENLTIGMSVSPDGRWVLASIGEKVQSDLMLVEGLR
jgi:Tol biopolymer transport system component